MININDIPESGIVYALYKDKVVLKKYFKKEEIDTNETNLLELHCFDSKKEYRYMNGKDVVVLDINNGNDKNSYIENVVTLYDKNIILDSNFDKNKNLDNRFRVNVVNYISYDENDMLIINNYRLMEVE